MSAVDAPYPKLILTTMPLPSFEDAFAKPEASWLSFACDMFLSSSWTIGRFEFSLSKRRCSKILRYLALLTGRTLASWSSAPIKRGWAAVSFCRYTPA